jgi:hypothetical protein
LHILNYLVYLLIKNIDTNTGIAFHPHFLTAVPKIQQRKTWNIFPPHGEEAETPAVYGRGVAGN